MVRKAFFNVVVIVKLNLHTVYYTLLHTLVIDLLFCIINKLDDVLNIFVTTLCCIEVRDDGSFNEILEKCCKC